MNAQAKADMDTLQMTPEQLAERTREMDELARGSAPAAESGKHRAPAVKGVCVNCGKHWSRHVASAQDKENRIAFCTNAPDSRTFTLERPAPAPEQAGTGKLTKEESYEIEEMVRDVIATFDVQTRAVAEYQDALVKLHNKLDALTAK